MFCGKLKAVTFSYDDGVVQDRRLVEILNKYGLRGTFNLNSQKLGAKSTRLFDDVLVDTSRIEADEVASLYNGHEVAAHTLTHPSLATVPIEEAYREVEYDRVALSRLVGYDVVGFAYPNGSVNDEIIEMLKSRTGIKYARWNGESLGFDMPCELYKMNYTVRSTNDDTMEIVKRFIEHRSDVPAVLSIWGHAYEFDAFDSWERFERVCELVAGHDDIFYGTSKDILLK